VLSAGACAEALRPPCSSTQDKSYSRNPTIERGRLRVVLRTEEDMPHNPDVPNRARPLGRAWRCVAVCPDAGCARLAGKALYKAVAQLLQEHPERKKRAAAGPAAAPAAVVGLPALPAPSAAGAAAGAAGGSSKKNKKGKK
jgi:hypothetical protein